MFLHQVYAGCKQLECRPKNSLVDDDRRMSESRTSAGASEKLPDYTKANATATAWSACCNMAEPATKCVERYCITS